VIVPFATPTPTPTMNPGVSDEEIAREVQTLR